MATSSQECSPAGSSLPPVHSYPTRIIRPLADKEAIQRNFVTLPNRASNLASQSDERFGIIERGYYLESHPDDIPCELDEARRVNLVPLAKQATLEERLLEAEEQIRSNQDDDVIANDTKRSINNNNNKPDARRGVWRRATGNDAASSGSIIRKSTSADPTVRDEKEPSSICTVPHSVHRRKRERRHSWDTR